VTDVMNDEKGVVDLDGAQSQPGVASDELVRQLAERARAEGLRLTGEGGLLSQLTKVVVESALDGELDDHLGYGKHDPAGRDGGNSRNGRRGKSVLTEAGPVSIEVPRDREGSFEPRLVKKRQRRLTGLDDLVISLSAKGLTHGEICAHLAEVYGASVSKQTISTITDRVLEGMAEWQSRPLDSVYPVIFIDAVNVKIRDGNVANRPIYIALAVTVEGTRDILGLWAGEHGDGEGAKFWARVLSEIKNRGTLDVCMVVCDGLKGLPAAIDTVWPQAITQTCTCCATASATPRRNTGRRWPRISNPFTPRPANRPPWMRSSPSPRRGATGTRRSSNCGSPRGRNLSHSCSSTPTFVPWSAPQMPLSPSMRGSAERSTPAATFPPRRPPRWFCGIRIVKFVLIGRG
jgi:hypothetical protein